MKKILFCLFCLIMCACTPSAEEKKFTVMPPELEDCRVFQLFDGVSHYTVFRCPDSTTSTTYKQGKSTKTVVVIDGKEFIEK